MDRLNAWKRCVVGSVLLAACVASAAQQQPSAVQKLDLRGFYVGMPCQAALALTREMEKADRRYGALVRSSMNGSGEVPSCTRHETGWTAAPGVFAHIADQFKDSVLLTLESDGSVVAIKSETIWYIGQGGTVPSRAALIGDLERKFGKPNARMRFDEGPVSSIQLLFNQPALATSEEFTDPLVFGSYTESAVGPYVEAEIHEAPVRRSGLRALSLTVRLAVGTAKARPSNRITL